jgi:hypothetical protein
MKKQYKIILIVGFSVALAMMLSFIGTSPNGLEQTLAMEAPPFIQNAQTTDGFDIGAYLDQEAGISAWLYTTTPINLTNAESAFRIIEDQTAEYIIGSVDIPNYEENHDVHAYIHTDGYILAYYLRPDPVSKIVNIKEKSITSTKLESAIGIVAGAAGVPSSGISHYDFRYPNAENILLVYEDNDDGNDFTIEMPGAFAYYERGFAARCYGACSTLVLDGTPLQFTYIYSEYGYGTISAASLAPDVTHNLWVGNNEWMVLVVVYSEP